MNKSDIYLKCLELIDAEDLLALRLRNRDFLKPFEPIREEIHYTLEGQLREIEAGIQSRLQDSGYTYGIFMKERDELIGGIALTGIARGPFQNAYLGYFIDEQRNGKDYATAAVQMCVKKAFNERDCIAFKLG